MTEAEIKKEEKIRDKEAKILQKIFQSIPKNLRDNMMSERYKNQDLLTLLDTAIAEPGIDEGKKEKYRIIRNDPKVQEKVFVENSKIIKMVDEALERGIKKEIEKGNLRPRTDKNLIKYEKYRIENHQRKVSESNEAKS